MLGIDWRRFTDLVALPLGCGVPEEGVCTSRALPLSLDVSLALNGFTKGLETRLRLIMLRDGWWKNGFLPSRFSTAFKPSRGPVRCSVLKRVRDTGCSGLWTFSSYCARRDEAEGRSVEGPGRNDFITGSGRRPT